MINHLFGNNNLKSGSELRLVGKRKKVHEKPSSRAKSARRHKNSEAWGTDAQEALRVPVLAKDHAAHLEGSDASLPAFGSKAGNKFALSAVNPFGIESVSQPKARSEASVEKIISSSKVSTRFGFYTQSLEYRARMKTILKKHDIEISYFDMDSVANDDALSQHSAWIVDLSNEQDCDTLDFVMDRCNEVPALFLFDHNITPNILAKLSEFICDR